MGDSSYSYGCLPMQFFKCNANVDGTRNQFRNIKANKSSKKNKGTLKSKGFKK